jgi:hypothetical protein
MTALGMPRSSWIFAFRNSAASMRSTPIIIELRHLLSLDDRLPWRA